MDNFNSQPWSCFCQGPQNSEPLCPCMMMSQGVYKRGNKWVRPEQIIGDVEKRTLNEWLWEYKEDA